LWRFADRGTATEATSEFAVVWRAGADDAARPPRSISRDPNLQAEHQSISAVDELGGTPP
jgi:hypothetical protein